MVLEFPATCWSLIARLPDQPQQAAALIGLYADSIGAYLQMRLSGERQERIEDVIQDVLVDLLAKPQTLAKASEGSGSRFRYYLMHIAWQAALNVLRHQRRRTHQSLDAGAGDLESGGAGGAEESAPAMDEQGSMDRAWAVSVLRQALDDVRQAGLDGRLGPDACSVLMANLIDGRGLRDIAADTGSSLATCSRRLAQARHFLREAIAERLRLAGEIGPHEDAAVAGDRLLAALAANCS